MNEIQYLFGHMNIRTTRNFADLDFAEVMENTVLHADPQLAATTPQNLKQAGSFLSLSK